MVTGAKYRAKETANNEGDKKLGGQKLNRVQPPKSLWLCLQGISQVSQVASHVEKDAPGLVGLPTV